MTAVINILLPLLAGGAALAGIYFVVRAFRDRSAEARAPYSVGKQSAHQAFQVDLARAAFSFIVALIFLSVSGLPLPAATGDLEPEAVEVTPPTMAATRTQTAVPAVSATSQPPPATATSPPPSNPPPPTDIPTSLPATPTSSPTATPEPRTAIVASGVGVWLRDEPNTDSEQLAWLLEGSPLLVLDAVASAEDLEWQQVQTDDGLIGWVAVPFITYEDQSP